MGGAQYSSYVIRESTHASRGLRTSLPPVKERERPARCQPASSSIRAAGIMPKRTYITAPERGKAHLYTSAEDALVIESMHGQLRPPPLHNAMKERG